MIRSSNTRLSWFSLAALTVVTMATLNLAFYTPVFAQEAESAPNAPVAQQLFLPQVASLTLSVSGQGSDGQGITRDDCLLNSEEVAIADRMMNDPAQGRATMHCNKILSQVARERAEDMATRGYLSHVNPDGFGPNYLVMQAGYPLPDWYTPSQSSNTIESIGGGYPNAEEVWNGWMNSPSYKTHILAENDFYAAQQEYGIGYVYAPDSPMGYYWVVIMAPAPTE